MKQTDIAIIGGGPAGMAAAAEAAEVGARVVLVDEYLRLGGQIFKQVPSTFELENPAALGKEYSRGRQLAELVSAGKVELWLDSLVWGAFPDHTLAISRAGASTTIQAEKIIIAAGAYDRPIPFPGWTLPGVMTAGAAQTMAKSQWVVPGSRVLLVGTGPFQLPVARQLIHAGVTLAAVVEATSFSSLLAGSRGAMGRMDRAFEGFGYWREIRASGTPFLFGHTILRALGDGEVHRAEIAAIDGDWRVRPGSERTLEVDAICLAFGFLPSTQITRLMGCAERFDPISGGFLPERNEDMESSQPGVFVVGESGGIGGSDAALAEGRLAAVAAVHQLGYMDKPTAGARLQQLRQQVSKARSFAAYLNRSFAPKPAAFERIPNDTVVCRCEEVTAGEIRQAVLEGADSLKAVKILTRAGMGLCQGRVCESVVAQLASLVSGRPLATFETARVRSPIKPVRLGDLAGAKN